MSKPEDISVQAWIAARSATQGWEGGNKFVEAIARAIMAAKAEERARWEPAAIYFALYCQDEAENAENCVCGEAQHEDAKRFAAVVGQRGEA